MGKADSLSRRSDWEKEGEKDNEKRILLKPESLEVKMGEVIVKRVNILEKIRKSEAKYDEVIKVVEEMKKVGVKMLRDKEWREENSIMLREGKVYVLKNEVLRVEIIILHYNIPIEGMGDNGKQ